MRPMRAPDPLPDPNDPAARARAVGAAAVRKVHPDVLGSLLVTTDAQARSRDALATGTCVVTGQQAGLFSGPLYTLHKAACAIVTARAIASESGVPCAPVFWLQDEDHDFEEIRHATLLGTDDSLHVASLDARPDQEGRSIWARSMGPSIHDALAVLDVALGDLPHAAEVRALFRDTHSAERSPAAAFRDVLEHLFAPHGLLVVDPADPRLVSASTGVHARAIERAAPIAVAMQRQHEALLAAGLPAPVHIRPEAPLSFVHPDGRDGPRFRATPLQDGRFQLIGGAAISAEALRLGPHSTSALLRPILQDTWLPTVAYVGGPGELAYLAQLPPLWRAFELPTPLIIGRSRFTLVDGTSERLLRQLQLSSAELLLPRDTLLQRLAPTDADPEPLRAALTEPLHLLDRFAEESDDGVRKSAAQTKASMTHSVDKFIARLRRSSAQRDEVLMQRLDRAQNRMAPGGAPQERVHAWPTYGARHGIQPLVQALLDAVVPFDGTLREVHL
jgi:bacillithiol synthase